MRGFGSTLSRRGLTLLVAVLSIAACEPAPVVGPTSTDVRSTEAEEIVGQMAVAFLNRFAASRVSPAACLVDFSDGCRGKRDELRDIEFNRVHFEILGARIAAPVVGLVGGGAAANVSVPCAFDSRAIKCESADCRVGDLGYGCRHLPADGRP